MFIKTFESLGQIMLFVVICVYYIELTIYIFQVVDAGVSAMIMINVEW